MYKKYSLIITMYTWLDFDWLFLTWISLISLALDIVWRWCASFHFHPNLKWYGLTMARIERKFQRQLTHQVLCSTIDAQSTNCEGVNYLSPKTPLLLLLSSPVVFKNETILTNSFVGIMLPFITHSTMLGKFVRSLLIDLSSQIDLLQFYYRFVNLFNCKFVIHQMCVSN